MATFPGAVPSYTSADPTKTLDQDNHTQRHNDVQGDLTAVATKLGSGSSTPTNHTVLKGNGTGTTAYGQVDVTADVTGALPVVNGGSGVTTSTGTGANVLSITPTLVTPKVDTINEATSSNGTTIGGVNIKSGALNTNNSVVTANITDNAVTASKLATSAITLGYAQSTSNFTLSSSQTTPIQITGLTVTVTIPAGGRRVEITAFCGAVQPASGIANIAIWDGTVGSGTQLNASNSSGSNTAVTCIAVVTPSAGSKTYNVSTVNSGTNNNTLGGNATQPMFILVKAI